MNAKLEHEIDQHSLTQQALQDSARRLRRSQKIGQLGDWEFNVATQQIYWSDQVYSLFERDPAQGPPTFEENMAYYYPADSEQLQAQVQRAIESGAAFDDDFHS